MNFPRWAEMTSIMSFILSLVACWMLVSEQGKTFTATKQWLLTLIPLIAIALAVLHIVLTYEE